MNDLIKDIISLDNSKSKVNDQLKQKIWKYIKNVEPMSNSEFWSYIPKLVSEIKESKTVEDAIHNFFCDYDEIKMVSFVKTYENKVGIISKIENIWELLQCSDDSWGDFCDSLPLKGEVHYNEVLNESIKGEEKWFKNIEENYIQMKLNRLITKRLPQWLHDSNNSVEKNYDSREDILTRENHKLLSEVSNLKKKLNDIKEVLDNRKLVV